MKITRNGLISDNLLCNMTIQSRDQARVRVHESWQSRDIA
jgi:hypothetical protein